MASLNRTPSVVDAAPQLLLRDRPDARVVMTQTWRNLLFLHADVDPEVVQPLLPPGLEVDTFPDAAGRERAWIGLVPFEMRDVRFRGLPPVPGHRAFPETNVRTYVRYRGVPGVWFFSLDAARWAACQTARMAFHLPYHPARMQVQRAGDALHYEGARRAGEAPYRVTAELGEDLGEAAPGTLEFFLVERYLLYAYGRGLRPWSPSTPMQVAGLRAERLRTGRVHHAPYRLRAVRRWHADEALLPAAGLPPLPIRHALFSEGVAVEVFGLLRPEAM